MAKVRVTISHKIDFWVAAKVEAFGYEAVVAVRKKSVARKHTLSLSTETNDSALGLEEKYPSSDAELEDECASGEADQQEQ